MYVPPGRSTAHCCRTLFLVCFHSLFGSLLLFCFCLLLLAFSFLSFLSFPLFLCFFLCCFVVAFFIARSILLLVFIRPLKGRCDELGFPLLTAMGMQGEGERRGGVGGAVAAAAAAVGLAANNREPREHEFLVFFCLVALAR